MQRAKSILNGICAGMAVLAGLFAALVAVVGIAVFLLLRLLGRKTTPPPARVFRPSWVRRREVIDVTTTEIRGEAESEPEVPSR
jgi:hypothetical protein